jgi:hypothetical protein
MLFGAALVVGACASAGKGGQSSLNVGSIVVDNRTGSEVVVYGVPGSRSVGVRLGNVRSFATATITVPRAALQGASDLVVRLHAIGGGRDWTSPRVTLNEDLIAKLDIRADARGDMSRSAFYTSPPPVSGNTH